MSAYQLFGFLGTAVCVIYGFLAALFPGALVNKNLSEELKEKAIKKMRRMGIVVIVIFAFVVVLRVI